MHGGMTLSKYDKEILKAKGCNDEEISLAEKRVDTPWYLQYLTNNSHKYIKAELSLGYLKRCQE